ncbi:MAG: GNAT family protein [Minwuia sp.]|nr:GNAT family protein [Minwuia sp.]
MFASMATDDARPLLRGRRIYLRPPLPLDWRAWAELRTESRAFLEPWEPTWPADALSRFSFRRRLRLYQRDARADLAHAFLIFRNGDDALLGGITMSNVRRGVTQAATIGYWMGQHHAQRGYMAAAITQICDWSFGEMGLHRLEAACLPENVPSTNLLRKCGFEEEGYARKYLRIAGFWRDHLLFATLEADTRPRFD